MIIVPTGSNSGFLIIFFFIASVNLPVISIIFLCDVFDDVVYRSNCSRVFVFQFQDVRPAEQTVLGVRRVGQSVGPDAVAVVRVGHVVRNGNRAAGPGPGAEASAADDGAQRTGDIPGVPGEGERVGEGAAEDKDHGRQSAEDGRAEIAEAGANAHDANLQGTRVPTEIA